jgi:methionine-S-sulfoxide reductase
MKTMQHLEKATFAGGCFWCMASAFEPLNGVKKVISGYTGGRIENPSHHAVVSGETGHFLSIQIWFNPNTISYGTLLTYFFHQIDPADDGGAFVDRGPQYRSAVFYHTHAQKELAQTAVHRINQSNIFQKPVATRVMAAPVFFKAGDRHQNYHLKNQTRFRFYRAGSGRDLFIEKFWQNGNEAVLDHLFSHKHVIHYTQGHEHEHGQIDGIKPRYSPAAQEPFWEYGHTDRQDQRNACQHN